MEKRKRSVKAKCIKILGIETSCDETSVALLSVSTDVVRLLHHETATQIPIHERYGGVVPEVAARMHVAEIISLLDRAGIFSGIKFDAIAVTRGPGLATALRVGLETGRALAFITGKTMVGVNHLEGHLASVWLDARNRKNWVFPILCLLVSGGHTELIMMKDFGKYKVVGRTRDDAAGEAFDKTAKLLGLSYPGGPALSNLASQGKDDAFDIPRPMLDDSSLDFSFSGLKSAVRRLVMGQENQQGRVVHEATKLMPTRLADMCASIERVIVDVLIAKTMAAAVRYKPRAIMIAGGVSANKLLQSEMARALRFNKSIKFLNPPTGYCTDNAAMIAAAGAWHLLKNKKGHDWKKMDAEPELDF